MYSYLKRILDTSEMMVVTLLVFTLALSGCMQSNASEGKFGGAFRAKASSSDISDNSLKLVNSAFTKSFLGGDWRYKGASKKNGAINAYIQIPRDLDMSEDAQKNYLKQAICPSEQHQAMWAEIQSIPLYVHVYTHTKKRSVYSGCANPIV